MRIKNISHLPHPITSPVFFQPTDIFSDSISTISNRVDGRGRENRVEENKLKLEGYIGYSRSDEWKKKKSRISIMAFHERTGMKTRGSPGVLSPKFPTLLTFSLLRFLSFERRPVLLLSPSTPAKSFAWFALAIAANVTGFLVRKEANNHPAFTQNELLSS